MTAIRPTRTHRTRGVLAVLAVAFPALVMLAFAPAAAGAQQPAPQNFTVSIRDFAFSSAQLMVAAGDTVTWVNEDRAPHDVTTTSAPAPFASDTLRQGQSYSYTFAAPGSYSYQCTIHPEMVASVMVMDNSAAPAAAPEPAEVAPPAPEVPAEEAPAADAPADSAPAETAPTAGAPVDGTVTTAPAVPPAGDPAATVPPAGAAPVGTQLAPGTTQVVGAAQQGRQLDPLLIIAGVALGVTTLCLLLVSAQSTSAVATAPGGAQVGGTGPPRETVMMTRPRVTPHRERWPVTLPLLLRVLAAAGLAVDGYVHFDLAADYDAVGTLITQGMLFRAQAAAAVLAALLILLIGRTWVYAVAFLVAASGLGPLLLYTYVDVGALGPMPNMYEPVWYPDKTFSAIGEAIATVAAAGLLALALRARSSASTGTGKGR